MIKLTKSISITPDEGLGTDWCGYALFSMHLTNEEWDQIREMLQKANPHYNGEELVINLRFMK